MDTDLQKIIEIWQPASERLLSQEDARQIADNLSGFFKVLAGWDALDSLAGASQED